MTMRDVEARWALALAGVRYIGAMRFRALVDRFGSAGAVGTASAGALRECAALEEFAFLNARLRGSILRLVPVPPDRLAALTERGIRVVTYGATGYPAGLSNLGSPPPVLYLRGTGELEGGPWAAPGAGGAVAPPTERSVSKLLERRVPDLPARVVAIVGTRKATEYGKRVAFDFAAALAGAGCSVVSGLARGIDAAAHEGALAAGGTTVGVLGCGLDHVAPPEHGRLYGEVAEQGVLVSEFEPSARPERGFFPRRNRIIAALARATVLVQAPRRSGALITVQRALDLGRDIFAVPGNIDVGGSEGVHDSLKDGATLAPTVDVILNAVDGPAWGGPPPLPPSSAPPASRPADPTAEASPPAVRPGSAADARAGRRSAAAPPAGASARTVVLARLAEGPAAADELARAARLEAGAVLALLSRLELEGRVTALPGGRFASPGALSVRRSR